jgi:hypothetical protein
MGTLRTDHAPECADVESMAALLRVTPYTEWPQVHGCGTCTAFEQAVERVLRGWTRQFRDTLTAAAAELVLATPERGARDATQIRAAVDRLTHAQALLTSAARLGRLVAPATSALDTVAARSSSAA